MTLAENGSKGSLAMTVTTESDKVEFAAEKCFEPTEEQLKVERLNLFVVGEFTDRTMAESVEQNRNVP